MNRKEQLLQSQAVQNPRHETMEDRLRAWEKSGRGWDVFDHEVEIEPAYSKFSVRQNSSRVYDDARSPTIFQRLFGAKNREGHSTPERNEPDSEIKTLKPAPRPPVRLASFRFHLPKELTVSVEQHEQLFLALGSTASFISFEIVASGQRIVFQITCPESAKHSVIAQLKSHLPSTDWRESGDVLLENLASAGSKGSLVVDFGLAKEWLVPLVVPKRSPTDSLVPLIASMEGLSTSEVVCLQVIFCSTRGAWSRSAQAAFFDQTGKVIVSHLQDRSATIKEKLSSPFVAVVLRLIVLSESKERSYQIARETRSFFKQFSSPFGNELAPLENDAIDEQTQHRSVLDRTSFRTGMLLNAKELLSFAHFPSDLVTSGKLDRDGNTTKEAPTVATRGELILGDNHHAGKSAQIRLDREKRVKHIHLVGASGSGKSSLLTQMMCQDLEHGNGFACFDPHGDLVDSIIERIPESRLKDVILFDPADEQFPIGFNILSAHSELEKTLLSSDLTAIFRRYSTSWGDQMNSVLANAVLAFLESSSGGSLLDLKRFLVEKEFRERFLHTVGDEEIVYYWRREFGELRGKPHAPLLTRLDTFLRSKIVRNIVAQNENRLDFRKIMDKNKILLVRLSLGAIGQENAYLLGSLLVTKLHLATLSRQDISEEERKPFFLYLDEAHHFLTPSMNQILSGVRKYKLGLVLAHQQLSQFHTSDADILESVLANCYTRVCFRLGDSDAERLAKGFSFFTSDHLRNLGVGEAIVRFEQSQFSFNLKTHPLEKVPTEVASARKAAAVEHTRKHYTRPKASVEGDKRHFSSASEPSVPKSGFQAMVPSKENETDPDPIRSPVPENDPPIRTGRGGHHHQELQNVIRRMGEKLGFRVEIEKPVLGGAERVDVSVETDNLLIACEVCVTTTDYEVHNAEKCVAAGYDRVFIVVSNEKKLPLIKKKLRTEIPRDLEHKIEACSLMGLLSSLQNFAGIDDSPRKAKQSTGDRLNFNEACELLGKAPSTVYRWINEGRVPFYRVGREYQFDRNELLLVGKHDLSGKRKVVVDVEPLKVGKAAPKGKKEQDARYRKLLKLD